MPHRCTRTNASLLTLLAGSIAGLITVMGCSDQGSESRQISEAARELGSVGAADSPSSTATYASVSNKISAIDVEGDTASAVAAGLLGQSLLGEASVTAKDAALAERSVLDDIGHVADLAARYRTLTTEAAALEAFDPTPDLDRIARETSALEADIRQARADRSALDERINDLKQRAAALRSESESKRNQAAEMELASSRMSASQAASRAGSIRTLTREADAIDMQVARLTGEVETLTPRLTEFDNEIDKLAQQIELAAEAGEDLRQMEATRASRASTARAEAAAIAERIRETVNAIDGTRTGTVIPAGEQATQSLERAMRESEKAARGIREAGTLGKAAAQRRLAELYQLRADGHARYADMLAKIGSMNELPNADSYTQASVSERATADDLIIFAAESYENAATSLASVNVRGTDPQRAAETADELNNLARRLRGNPPPAENQPATDPALDQPETPAADGDNDGEP